MRGLRRCVKEHGIWRKQGRPAGANVFSPLVSTKVQLLARVRRLNVPANADKMVDSALWEFPVMAAGPLEPGEPVPSKYAGVIRRLDDLFLESLEGVTTFAVQQRPARGVSSIQPWTLICALTC